METNVICVILLFVKTPGYKSDLENFSISHYDDLCTEGKHQMFLIEDIIT